MHVAGTDATTSIIITTDIGFPNLGPLGLFYSTSQCPDFRYRLPHYIKGGAIPDENQPVLNSINKFPGNGAQISFEINFTGGFISRSHVSATIINAAGASTDTPFTWVTDTTITVSPPVPVGSYLRVARVTPYAAPIANFSDGFILTERNLDANASQAVFLAQESMDLGRENVTEYASRSLLTPIGEAGLTLPAKSSRINKLIGTTADGTVALLDPLPGPQGEQGLQGFNGTNGGVGSSAGFAGLASAANGMAIGAGVTRVRFSGYDVAGLGGADYVKNAFITPAIAAANPRTCFVAADGAGFFLDANQRLDLTQFGGGPGKTGAVNSSALIAAAEFKPLNAHSPQTKLGVGTHNISATFEPNAVFSLSGQSSGYTPGSAGQGDAATHIVAPVDTTVIRIRCGSIGDGTPIGAPLVNAGGSTIEGLRIRNSGTSLDAHGIHARGTLVARYIQLDVAGDGINITATSSGYDPYAPGIIQGNANHFSVMHPFIVAGGNGICVGNYKGNNGAADTNAGVVFHPVLFQTGLCGIYDQSFYANTYYSPHFNGYNGKELGQCWHGGFTWQLVTRVNTGTQPGTDSNVWFRLRLMSTPDSYWKEWDAGKLYRAGLPMLASNQPTVITPYQEGMGLFAHIPSGLVIGGNLQVTQKTPRINGNPFGLACNMGVGHARSAATDNPAYPYIGDSETTVVGGSGSDTEIDMRARIMQHVVKDNGFEIGYLNTVTDGRQYDIYAQQGILAGGQQFWWSVTGTGTTRTYGRAAPVAAGLFTLHEHGLVDAENGNNSCIHGLRSTAPTGAHGHGDFYWNAQPLGNGGILGWSTTAAGAPGTQTPVRIYGQMLAQGNLSGDATLADLISGHNALLTKLRSGGFMAV